MVLKITPDTTIEAVQLADFQQAAMLEYRGTAIASMAQQIYTSNRMIRIMGSNFIEPCSVYIMMACIIDMPNAVESEAKYGGRSELCLQVMRHPH